MKDTIEEFFAKALEMKKNYDLYTPEERARIDAMMLEEVKKTTVVTETHEVIPVVEGGEQ